MRPQGKRGGADGGGRRTEEAGGSQGGNLSLAMGEKRTRNTWAGHRPVAAAPGPGAEPRSRPLRGRRSPQNIRRGRDEDEGRGGGGTGRAPAARAQAHGGERPARLSVYWITSSAPRPDSSSQRWNSTVAP
ncbi:unnamed protein product, partial [Prorocentrum cordatum]